MFQSKYSFHPQGRRLSQANKKQGTAGLASSETSVNFYTTRRRQIPEDTLYSHRSENLKSNTKLAVWWTLRIIFQDEMRRPYSMHGVMRILFFHIYYTWTAGEI
jgi:hypothetical protein